MDNEKSLSTPSMISEEVARIKGITARTTRLLTEPNLIDVICTFVAQGGSLINLCQMWAVKYADVITHIRAYPELSRQYDQALRDREEWIFESILQEIRMIASSDIKELYGESGSLKAPHEWPEHIRRAVQAVETKEMVGDDGKVGGQVNRVKLWDKLKAVEMILKTMGKLTERHHHEGDIRLEDVIVGSFKRETD